MQRNPRPPVQKRSRMILPLLFVPVHLSLPSLSLDFCPSRPRHDPFLLLAASFLNENEKLVRESIQFSRRDNTAQEKAKRREMGEVDIKGRRVWRFERTKVRKQEIEREPSRRKTGKNENRRVGKKERQIL